MASASIAKSATWETGPTPVFTATNQRPVFVIWGAEEGNDFGRCMTCPVRESSVISSSARSRLGAAGDLFCCGSVVYHYSTHRPASAIGRASWPTATTLIFVAPSRTLHAVCQTIGET